MAGSGTSTTYTSSADYHDTVLNDYNDNVIVPKSILIDTADAIRGKRDGSTQITVDTDPVSGENYITSGITPENFASVISASIGLGWNTFKNLQLWTDTPGGSSYGIMQGYGSYKNIVFLGVAYNKTATSSSVNYQHGVYFYTPNCWNYTRIFNDSVYLPLYHIDFNGRSGNTYTEFRDITTNSTPYAYVSATVFTNSTSSFPFYNNVSNKTKPFL